MDSSYVNCIAKFIRDLIPSCKVNMFKVTEDLSSIYDDRRAIVCNNGKKVSFKIYEREFEVYLESLSNCYSHKIVVTKMDVDFSKAEKRLLSLIPKAIRSTNIMSTDQKIYQPQIIEAESAFHYFVIAQMMRGVNQTHWGAPIHYLRLLQGLTFQKYESNQCTSGFVCVKKIKEFLRGLDKNENYIYIPFEKPIRLSEKFFSKPASYRYVDGRNSFYLGSRNEHVEGIICIKEPQRYNIIDRCAGKHIEELLALDYCKWISYVGYSQDVVLYSRGYSQIKWEKNRWILREKEQIERLLMDRMGCDTVFANSISKVIYTLSELHMGSLVLISNDEIPTVKGKIDNSALGNELYTTIKNMKCSDLIASNRILGLLSSDGLTVFNKDGIVIDCGSIIDLTGDCVEIAGGGRTQAAAIASNCGIAIKVSEDGPISVFEQGKCILSI